MIERVLVVVAVLALAFGAGWHYGQKGPSLKLAKLEEATRIRDAQELAAAKREMKRNENDTRIAQAAADAAKAAIKRAILGAKQSADERDAALVRLGGVVHDLDDARRLLAGSGTRSDSGRALDDAGPPLRTADSDSWAGPAGGLSACRADLTVLTRTDGVNADNLRLCLAVKDEVIRLYDQARSINNGGAR